MVSLNKANRESERDILIEAGLLTPHVANTWVHYYACAGGTAYLHLANGYRTSSCWRIPIIISARDLVVLFSLKALNPKLGAETLLKAIKLNARNRHVLKYSGINLEQ